MGGARQPIMIDLCHGLYQHEATNRRGHIVIFVCQNRPRQLYWEECICEQVIPEGHQACPPQVIG